MSRAPETGLEAEPEKSLAARGFGIALAVLASLPVGGALFAAVPSTVEAATISQTIPAPQSSSARALSSPVVSPPLSSPSQPAGPAAPSPAPPPAAAVKAAPRRPAVQKGDFVAHGVNFSALMTDEEFLDSESLTASQIQGLFEKSGSFLATFYEQGRSAATIVADAAHDHGINPRVLLATLEKENSLVSRPTKPANWVLRSAMGYAYNDGGGTAGRHSTFSSQVDQGAQLLRNLFTEGQQGHLPQQMQVDYGRRVIRVNNAATYALMRYTPHTIDTNLGQVGGGNYLFGKVMERVNGMVEVP